MPTLWVTKHALTVGIKKYEQDGVESEHGYVGLVGTWFCACIGKTAFKTENEAKAAAEKMRIKKIAGLQKQIKKLEAMRF